MESLDAALDGFAGPLIRAKARRLAKRPSLRGLEAADLEQELWLALAKARLAFQPGRWSVERRWHACSKLTPYSILSRSISCRTARALARKRP